MRPPGPPVTTAGPSGAGTTGAGTSSADAATDRPRVLILTGDRLGPAMGGPAIRAWQIARILSAGQPVRLVSTDPTTDSAAVPVAPGLAPFDVRTVDPGRPTDLDPHLDWADVVVVQGHGLRQFPALRTTGKVLVCDVYDPMHLEQLEQARQPDRAQWAHTVDATTDVLNEQLRLGDFFVCASERQRYFWLGQLAAVGRINPDTYTTDPSLRRLIDVAPFGIDETPPRRTRHALRGTVPGIGPDDRIVLWAGGIYNWFDPDTLVRAVGRLAARRPDLRLFFLGTRPPSAAVPAMRAAADAARLADDLGLTGRHVFFNDGWVDFDDRQNYLLDADCGVSTHLDHIEATFAFRTRMLDYLWAGLPVVSTTDDSFDGLIHDHGLGRTVPPQDVDALADALDEVLYRRAGATGRAPAALVEQLGWPHALAALTAFCRNPAVAPDRHRRATTGGPTLAGAPPTSARRDLSLALDYLRAGGPREVLRRVAGRLRRLLPGASGRR